MPEAGLIHLMSEVGRLTHRRSSTPRSEALGLAYRKIMAYADVRHLDEEWCDTVMLLFIREDFAYAAA